jgi:hypothetical protein
MIGVDTLKKRVKVMFDLNSPVHIITKDETWLNGYILSMNDDYFLLLDRKDGEIPIFYVDVTKFEFFTGDVSTLKKKEVGG